MIIGLSGWAQSGKDTVANILVEEYGYKRIAFADKIRECIYALNPMVSLVANEPIYLQHIVDANGWENAKKNPEVRRLLQVFGTEVGRKLIDDQIWVELALGGIEPGDNVVVTDVRFPNEATEIKWAFGEVWRIYRLNKPINDHESERALDGWRFDKSIDNTGTLEELKTTIRKIMQ